MNELRQFLKISEKQLEIVDALGEMIEGLNLESSSLIIMYFAVYVAIKDERQLSIQIGRLEELFKMSKKTLFDIHNLESYKEEFSE